jgi:hypothetical protein
MNGYLIRLLLLGGSVMKLKASISTIVPLIGPSVALQVLLASA